MRTAVASPCGRTWRVGIAATAQEQSERVWAPAGWRSCGKWYMDVLRQSNRWRVDCDDRAESRRSGRALWMTTRQVPPKHRTGSDSVTAVASPCGRPGRGIWIAATDATLRQMGVDQQESRRMASVWLSPLPCAFVERRVDCGSRCDAAADGRRPRGTPMTDHSVVRNRRLSSCRRFTVSSRHC